jgi:hypothetical protein
VKQEEVQVSKERTEHCSIEVWDVVYVYIETTTYCSDIQAFIVVTRYTDGFTAGRR